MRLVDGDIRRINVYDQTTNIRTCSGLPASVSCSDIRSDDLLTFDDSIYQPAARCYGAVHFRRQR
ncbi:MAG TPA: hypothetical protein VK364_02620, partial [Hymenobacter sp.]|nr:hypothetical protein [Hymenobacter sp.]